MLSRIIYKLKKKIGLEKTYHSETEKVRDIVIPYCQGYGCDIGFGGDKIKSDAIGIDLPTPYTTVGGDKVDIPCDVINEPIPVVNDTYDYVYSSHLIEDLEDTLKGINEFIRILKSGGNLILVFPDQQIYEKVCRRRGQPLNQYHKHADMGLVYMKQVIRKADCKNFEILKEIPCYLDYNVILVARIHKK